MIGETAFKGLCSHAAKGCAVRALFITPNALERDGQKIDMMNVANARGLSPVWRQPLRAIQIDACAAYLRIAHPHLDEELRGLEWHFIHGLEYLTRLDDGDAIGANLIMKVRA